MTIMDSLEAYGHSLITGSHYTTFEITKDDWLTTKGSCIIGIKASKSVFDLSKELKNAITNDKSIITIVLQAGRIKDKVVGFGDPSLTLTDHRSLVFRKSDFICERTLMVRSNKAAIDLSRELINSLKNPQTKLTIEITVQI